MKKPTANDPEPVPQDQTPNSPVANAASSSPAGPQPGPATNDQLQTPNLNRRKGKIARLPKKLRERLNLLLQEGLPYAEIIAQLRQSSPPLPDHISEQNLSRWHHGGYQDWLRHQAWLEEMRARLDFASDVLGQKNGDLLDAASLRIATIQLYTFLLNFDPSILEGKIQASPGIYPRLLNSLCKMTEGSLKFERYRHEEK